MTLTWIIQGDPLNASQCRLCKRVINPMSYFFRACGNQDGGDEFGYDVCFQCRKTLPATPPALAAIP